MGGPITLLPCWVISTLPDGSVHMIGPSARLTGVLAEGGGLYLIAHSPAHDTFRHGLHQYMAGHPRITAALKNEIAATGMIPLWLAREWEFTKYVRDPSWGRGKSDRQAFAWRWIDAKHHGGIIDWREAVMLIWEYSQFCGSVPQDVTAPEIVLEDDLPEPKPWQYRPAWRRGRNGGPIAIDKQAAVALDEARCWQTHEGDVP